MKSIDDYIKESLINKSNIHKIVKRGKDVKFNWPEDETRKNFRLVKFKNMKKYVIYEDPYHNVKHLATFGDMICLHINTFCFEDLSPNNVYATFDKLKDAVEYIIKDPDFENGKYYDTKEFIDSVLAGEITDNNFEDPDFDIDPEKFRGDWDKWIEDRLNDYL